MTDITKEFDYGIIAINKEGNVLHFAGFMERPGKVDFDELREELKTYEEFGLVDKMDGLTLVEAPQSFIKAIKEDINKNGSVEVKKEDIHE